MNFSIFASIVASVLIGFVFGLNIRRKHENIELQKIKR